MFNVGDCFASFDFTAKRCCSAQDARNDVQENFMHNSKTKWFVSLIVLALMLTVVGGVSAQDNVAAQSNVDVTLSAGSDAITVGDVIPLTLRVTHPAGWRVIVPTLEKQWGEFEVRSQSTPVITTGGKGTERTTQTIEVVRMRPGEAQTPAFTLSIADDQGNLQDVEVAPVSVMVQSVLVASDTELRDLKPQADLMTSQQMVWPLITAGALGVIGLIGYVIHRRRHRPIIDKRTPRERTLATLKMLEAHNPQTPEGIKAACVDIAVCLRDYVASTTTIPARDLTTSELARQLKLKDLPAEWSARTIDVLRVCDSVKFACDVLELTTIHGLIDTVELLVEQYPPAPPVTQPTKHTRLNGVTA
jgi:hypothetical protein